MLLGEVPGHYVCLLLAWARERPYPILKSQAILGARSLPQTLCPYCGSSQPAARGGVPAFVIVFVFRDKGVPGDLSQVTQLERSRQILQGCFSHPTLPFSYQSSWTLVLVGSETPLREGKVIR